MWAHQPGEWSWRTADGADAGRLALPDERAAAWPAAPLRMSGDRRHLVDGDGAPFLYVADTAWLVVRRGCREQWIEYLDHRARQGFSAIQVNLLPWQWDHTLVEGDPAFFDDDPLRPSGAFFGRFDEFLTLAAERGLYVCLVLLWGGTRKRLAQKHWRTEEAVRFARYAVARFGAFPVLWSLSGDSDYSGDLARWETVGAAVEAADPYGHPTTMHLGTVMNWHFAFHGSPWHDFHMLQTGHERRSTADIAALPTAYRRLGGAKGVVNGEPWYEAHANRDDGGFGPPFNASDARYAFWTSVLSGATIGHTYGAQGVWNWRRPDDRSEHPTATYGPVWNEALHLEGAEHCALGVRLLRGLPWHQLEPAPERVDIDPLAQPPAAAHAPGRLWLVYAPAGARAIVLKGVEPIAWRARWVDLRSGDGHDIEHVLIDNARRWRVPAPPDPRDWLLMLETPPSGVTG